MEPDDHVEGYVGERGETRRLGILPDLAGGLPACWIYSPGKLPGGRDTLAAYPPERAIDARQHLLFLENFEEMI